MHDLKKRQPNIWMIIAVITFCMFALFLLFPVISIFYKSVISEQSGSFTLEYFLKFFEKKHYWEPLVNSFKVALCVTVCTALIGTLLAYVTKKVKIKGQRVIDILIVISMLSPPFIGAYSWILLLGRSGVVTKVLNQIFGVTLPGIYGFGGIMLVFTLQLYPLIYMYISGALKSLDNSINEASESLGCSGLKHAVKIVLPLIIPTLLAGSLLVFMRSMADFGTPILIGEGYKVMPVLIFNEFISEVSGNDAFAAALCIIIIFVTTVLFLVQKFIAVKKAYGTNTAKALEPKKIRGWKNILAHVFVYAVVAVTMVPQATVLYTSFLKTSGLIFVEGYSFDSYENAISRMGGSIFNTFLYGVTTIIIIVVLGIVISYISVRRRNPLTNLLDTVSMMPYIIPGSALGIALLLGFNHRPLLLSGSAAILIISFVMRRLPYTIRSSAAILSQTSISIEEAAISLGSRDLHAFGIVTVPMMMPGVLAGAIMSWITVISELSSSIILYVGKTRTMTVAIYSEVVRGNYGNAAALSTILILTTVISLMIFFKLTGRKDIDL